jgi:LuxR family maltose regulon positive regulatory protein
VRIAQRRAERQVSLTSSASAAREQIDLQPIFGYLDRYLRYVQKWGATCQAIEALALRALAQEIQGDVCQAVKSIQQALGLGEPEGYVNAFVQEGAPMARLLRQVAARSYTADYVRRLFAEFPSGLEDEMDASALPGSALVGPLNPAKWRS